MISIIICSRKADISQELKDNIASTIGCEYELCIIDNSNNDYNIFTAYNEGVCRANGDILCFMHEDILFRCEDWGGGLQDLYSRESSIGAIGVVGGQFLGEIPLPWWDASPMVGKLIQGNIDSNGVYESNLDDGGAVVKLTDVVALDGCFITIRSSLFSTIMWDNNTYNGFHLYDMDICTQIITNGYRVCITPDILLEHRSRGYRSKDYNVALAVFYNKWQTFMPLYRGISLNRNEIEWRRRCQETFVAYEKAEAELERLRHSKAYRLRKFLLKPYNWIRKKL